MTAKSRNTRNASTSRRVAPTAEVGPSTEELAAAEVPAVDEAPIVAPTGDDPAAEEPAVVDELAERVPCRIGRDIDPEARECPRSEFDPGTGLCNLHFVTRLDLREVARHD